MTEHVYAKVYRTVGPNTWEFTCPVFEGPAALEDATITAKVISTTDPGSGSVVAVRWTRTEDLSYEGPSASNLLMREEFVHVAYNGVQSGWDQGFSFLGTSYWPAIHPLWYGVLQFKITVDAGQPSETVFYLPEDLPRDADLWADFSLPLYLDASVDTVPAGSAQGEGTVGGTDPIGVDLDGDGDPDVEVEVKPLDPDIPDPAAPPGSGYEVVVTDPKGGGTKTVGYLPAGANPNDPIFIRVDGRIITVLYDGQVIVTYLIPESHYSLNVSEFWIGYVDPDGHMTTPVPTTPPPLGGFAYAIDTGFWEVIYTRQLGPVKNRYSETIWERGDGSIAASRIPYDPDLHDPATKWWVTNGHVAVISHDLAVRIWEAGLSRFLTPIP